MLLKLCGFPSVASVSSMKNKESVPPLIFVPTKSLILSSLILPTRQESRRLDVICSQGCQGMILKLNHKNISSVDTELLAGAMTKLDSLEISNTKLTKHQIVAILTTVSEGHKMTKLNISFNNMSGVDPQLLAKTVTKTKQLNVTDTDLTQEQAEAIFTALSEEIIVTELHIGFNDLSGVDTGLLAKAVKNLKILNVNRAKLTPTQIVTILTAFNKGSILYLGGIDLSRVDQGLLARTVTNLEVLELEDTELSQQQVVAIITAVTISNKITDLFIGDNDLSKVDPVLMAKAVTKLVRLDVENTKLTQQQNEAILHALEGSKMTKLYIGVKDMLGIDSGRLPNAVVRLLW